MLLKHIEDNENVVALHILILSMGVNLFGYIFSITASLGPSY